MVMDLTAVRTSGLAALTALLVCSSAATAQECVATVQSPDVAWGARPSDNSHPNAALRIMSHLVCRGCQPEVSMLLTAGPASPNMPAGDKTGTDWARAVYADPANREGLRQSVLRSELRSSAGCRLDGAVTGVAEIGNLGMVGTAIRAACGQNVTLLGEFYSGYDGACLYQVQVVWGPGNVEFSPQTRDAVRKLLTSVRFGR
jgi:hypothetical protein